MKIQSPLFLLLLLHCLPIYEGGVCNCGKLAIRYHIYIILLNFLSTKFFFKPLLIIYVCMLLLLFFFIIIIIIIIIIVVVVVVGGGGVVSSSSAHKCLSW